MEFEEALNSIKKKGNSMFNLDWNGISSGKKTMRVKIQYPDEHSMNTVPYLIMESSDHGSDVGITVGPWMPSNLDLFSDNWTVKYGPGTITGTITGTGTTEEKENTTKEDEVNKFRQKSKY